MAKFISGGSRREVIQYTPQYAVRAGEVVIVADRALIAPHAIPAGKLGVLYGGGVWSVDKVPLEEWIQGERLWFDSGTQLATTVSYTDSASGAPFKFHLGSAVEPAKRGDTSGIIALDSAPGGLGSNLMQSQLIVERINDSRFYAKLDNEAWVIDQPIYWDALAQVATTQAAGNTLLGRAARAVPADFSGGRVYLGA